MQVEHILSDRDKAHATADAEELLLRYQVVQRSMETNSANLTDEWFIDQQMCEELDKFDKLPSGEMDKVRKLWDGCLGPSRTKLQALSVVIDPRIWDSELKGKIKLDDKVIRRAELAFDELVNKLADEEKRMEVNKTWCALRHARRARLQPDQGQSGDHVFYNASKISRANVIGPWKWWFTYGGASHATFVHDIARVVLNLRCNSSATERVNSMYKHVIGLSRCRMNNDRAEKLVYAYVNSRAMKHARKVQQEEAIALARGTPIFELPLLKFDMTNQDPNVYGSLGHDPLSSIGIESFVANDHVHELNDISNDLSAHACDVENGASESPSSPLSGIDEEAEDNQDDDTFTDEAEDLSPETQREIDEMLERQNKRARGLHVEDKECKTPPYPRAARRARVSTATTPPASRIMSNDPVPLVAALPTRDHVAHESHQPINTLAPSLHLYQNPTHAFNNSLALNPYHYAVSVNLLLGNAMHALPPSYHDGTRPA